MNELMTLSEMMIDYRNNEMQISKMDMNNLSERDFQIIKDYIAEKQLFTRVRDGLEYTAASTLKITTLPKGATIDSIHSLDEKEEYANRLRILSNNMDSSFTNTVYIESLGDVQTALQRKEKADNYISEAMDSPEVSQAYTDVGNVTITVLMLSNAARQAENLMERHEINKEDILTNTEEKVYECYSAGNTHTIDKDISKSKATTKNLEIIESNDGYVMATNVTPEELQEHPELQREFSEKVQNGNEVVHNEAPRETTIDLSEVGGHVKYEQFDDIGSVEKQQGIPDYETKEEMAVVAQKQSTENSKAKTETPKTPKHKSADMER